MGTSTSGPYANGAYREAGPYTCVIFLRPWHFAGPDHPVEKA